MPIMATDIVGLMLRQCLEAAKFTQITGLFIVGCNNWEPQSVL